MFSTHESLSILRPHLHSYISKVNNKEIGNSEVNFLETEHYAKLIFSRAIAVQNAYEHLKLSIEYLEKGDFPASKFDFKDHHKYHLECFYISLFSVIDRCYLLVGSSILFDESQIENIKGKELINKRLKSETHLSNVLKSLNTLNSNVNKFKKIRNKITHNNSFSNEHLEILGFLKIIPDISSKMLESVSLNDAEMNIKEELMKKTKVEVDSVKCNLEADLNRVFQELHIIYCAYVHAYASKIKSRPI
ncbi:hypothetical protein H5A20_02210 [Pectobacterium brasiliense]|uniref:Cthe_2314 family HEPN domain-containing protein n=1 Tax=Pectobacterium brasiliense TaxID=180957 RepID=UPI001968EDF1|nr:Cthe_2314 family HEPN domain-containing protein [Pectobacterium brasiliense]MBN3197518.1 hypothetical protein [Pectobacterium brasiliense]